jgi:hypothetical protein
MTSLTKIMLASALALSVSTPVFAGPDHLFPRHAKADVSTSANAKAVKPSRAAADSFASGRVTTTTARDPFYALRFQRGNNF